MLVHFYKKSFCRHLGGVHTCAPTLQLTRDHYRWNQPNCPAQLLANVTFSQGRISATCRSFPIISVNTRPGDTETKQAWQRLKKNTPNVRLWGEASCPPLWYPAAGWCLFDHFIRKFGLGVKEVPYVCAAAIRLNYSCQRAGELSWLCAPRSEWP